LQQREGKENMRVKRGDDDGVLMNNGFEEQWRLKPEVTEGVQGREARCCDSF
jgi:hypothetical protein